MKQSLLIIIVFLCALCSLAACDRRTDNGEIDGNWKMTEKIRLSPSGEAMERADMRQESYFWAFQLELLQLKTPVAQGYSPFKIENGKLVLPGIYVGGREKEYLAPDAHTDAYEGTGIHGNRDTFAILRLDDQEMKLRSAYYELHFIRF